MWKIQIFIFYASFLVFPFLIFLFYKIKNWKNFNKRQKIFFVFLMILSIFFIDNRFIEPNIITVNETKINIWLEKEIKIVLIADIHLWIYKKWDFLEKIVNKINNISDLDYVFIAWDLTYLKQNYKKEDLKEYFSVIKKIKVPVYWVLWNHDVWYPWPKVREELVDILNKNWANFLNNNFVKLKWFTLVWLGSNWWWEDDVSILENFKEKDKIIVLTHNPDTTRKYNNKIADLTLCWHTHWGQIKIPFLYKKVIPTYGQFDEWLTQEKNTQLFITSGLWIIGLPFRFLNPPVIDILKIN